MLMLDALQFAQSQSPGQVLPPLTLEYILHPRKLDLAHPRLQIWHCLYQSLAVKHIACVQ